MNLSGRQITLLRSFYCALAFAPFLFFVSWPTSWLFYFSAIGVGLLAVYADVKVYDAPRRFGAGVTARVLPLAPLFSFVLWYVFYPSDIHLIWSLGVWHSVGVVVCLLGGVISLMLMRRCQVSSAALLFLLPALLAFMVNDVLNKTAQEESSLWSGVFVFSFILMLCAFLSLAFPYVKKEGGKKLCTFLFSKEAMIAMPLAVAYFLAIIARCFSMSETPNPSFTSMIGLSTPLLIMFYDKFRGKQDESRLIPGLLLLVFVAGLILLTAGLTG